MSGESSGELYATGVREVVNISAVLWFSFGILFVLSNVTALLSYAASDIRMLFVAVVVSSAVAWLFLRWVAFRFFKGAQSGGLQATARFAMLLASIGLLIVLSCLRNFVPVFDSMALAVCCMILDGSVIGQSVSWWVLIWSGLFVIDGKKAVFVRVMSSALLAAVFHFLLVQFGDAAPVMSLLVPQALMLLSIIGSRSLQDLAKGALAEIGIDVDSATALRETPRLSEGRSLATLNSGVVFSVWVVLSAWVAPSGSMSAYDSFIPALTSLFLVAMGLLSKTIPNVGHTDRIVNLTFGIASLLILVDFGPLTWVCLFLLGMAMFTYLMLAMSNCALMVPAWEYRPVDVCNFVLSKFFLGLAIGGCLVFVLTSLCPVGTEGFLRVPFVFVGVLTLLEASLFPYENKLLRHLYEYSNEVEQIDAPEQSGAALSLAHADDRGQSQSTSDLFAEMDFCCDAIADEYRLTSRELEVLKLLARGRDSAYITEKLVISYNTTKSHIYNIYRKMGVSSRHELHAIIDARLLPPVE